jgi:DNA-binding winged helix-turn-helix (wHTH) protein
MSQVETRVAGYRFDSFYIDAANRQLWRDGVLLSLNSKYFDVLLLLASHSGQLVEKSRIFEEIWAGVFVTDAALTQGIKDIRRQLGDDASNPRYIKTVPKHGYIFIGSVVPALAGESIAASSQAASLPVATAQPASSALVPAAVALSSQAAEAAGENGAWSRAPSRPYKFLDYYTEQDASLFFGRMPEVEAICSQILAHRSFILHGRSGVGKSSIIRAGLMPRLRLENHHVFVIRSFTDPLQQMASALAQVTGVDALSHNALPHEQASLAELVESADRLLPARFVIFFLDQFEEFFSLLSEEARKNFLDAIADLVARESFPLRLVFALREDMLAEMSQVKPAIPEIFHHEYRLKRLSREQAALAITEPANAVGCKYEAHLVERLLDDLSDEGSIDPPQLQIVCDNLYDSRCAGGKLNLSIYERLGGASQILAGYLERVLRRFNAGDLQVVKNILTAMISAEGQRLVLRASELDARIKVRAGDGATRIEQLIDELIAARVVRRRSQEGESWLELAHDFLTPEVSRWLTADDFALKQARGVIERAMENYRAHELLIDVDALDLLLPFGKQLSLTGQEADLLMVSLLNRARPAPEWLAGTSPGAQSLIGEASENADSEVRLRAVEAARLAGGEGMKALLRRLALWDENLLVRKAASIALADWLAGGAEEILSKNDEGENVGTVRRAISLAMIRDYDKRLVQLSHLTIPVSLLVVGGLMWVRLRRGGAEIIRQGIGGVLGGAASGFVGGLMLGIGLAVARHAAAFEAISLVLVLTSLGFFIGAIGGFGVSFGMISASLVAYRHSRWWSVVGGAAGGAIVGGSSKLLGVDTVRALFGQSPTGITGAFEGAVLGVGVSLGAILVAALLPRARAVQRVFGASLGAMCAGILLTVIGGNLFSGSLEIVARLFADSQMRMEPLAPFFGEVHFGQTTQIVLGAIEGLLFGAGVTGGIELFSRSRSERTWAALSASGESR